jgi:hypothetical protein
MKKAIVLLSALILLVQVGCATPVRYTEEEIKGSPPDIQDYIRKGEIALGMTPKEVRYAWGSPETIKILEAYSGKTREEWIYSTTGTFGVVGTKILLFFDGKLIYIK